MDKPLSVSHIFAKMFATDKLTVKRIGRYLKISVVITSLLFSIIATSTLRESVAQINSPPIANAGLDQIVNEGSLVTLNGTNSYDPDNDTITYLWEQISGTNVTLDNATSPSPSFTAPSVTSNITLTFRLTVSDGSSNSTDTVDIIVNDIPSIPGTISGSVFQDSNLNGIKDTGELGKFGWSITLTGVLTNGTSISPINITSGVGGVYQFSQLGTGIYTVSTAPVNDWGSTTSSSVSVNITSGANIQIDFGKIILGQISADPFNDIKADGIKNGSDVSIFGWPFTLNGKLVNGTIINPISITSTPLGKFTNLFPGSYNVTAGKQTGWTNTTQTIISNINIASNSSSISFGNFKAGKIKGILYNDTNNNGVRNSGEGKLPGWNVTLFKDGNLFASVLTNNNSVYLFSALTNGTYSVSVTLPSPYIITQPLNNSYTVTINSGSAKITGDFGVFKNPLPQITGTPLIQGNVYNDTNGNNIYDAGEIYVPGWNVTLFKNGNMINSTLTDSNGSYLFSALTNGTYSVSVTLPSPYIITQPLNNSYTVTINSSDQNVVRDFGIYKNPSSLTSDLGDLPTLWPEEIETHGGFIYIADTVNHVIRKFDPNGTEVSVLGQGLIPRPTGLAIESSGNIWVSAFNDKIYKLDPNGNLLFTIGSTGNATGQFNDPRGLAVDSLDNLYVADGGNHRIQVFDSNGTFIKSISSGGIPNGYLRLPYDVAVDSQGNVIIADSGNNRIQKFDTNGNLIKSFGSGGKNAGQFNRPRSVTIGYNDSIYVADTYNHRIQILDSNGNFITKFGVLGADPGEFGNPSGVVVDNNLIYVMDTANDRIQVFDNSGIFIAEFPVRPIFIEPYFVIIDDFGQGYISDGHTSKIFKFNTTTGNIISTFGELGTASGEFNGPRGMDINSAGYMYIGDNYNDRIQKFDVNGTFIMSFGSKGSAPGQFNQIRGIVFDRDGNLLVADTVNNRIQKFDVDGNFISSFSSTTPYQIAVDGAGNIYSAEFTVDKVVKYDSDGNVLLSIGSEGTGAGQFNAPKGVFIDSAGNIWVADSLNNRIQKFDVNGTFIMSFGSFGSAPGQFSQPRGIFIDSAGNIWVADAGNGRIQEFDSSGNFIMEVIV